MQYTRQKSIPFQMYLQSRNVLKYSPLVPGPICSRKLLFVQQKILLTCYIIYPGSQKKFGELINKGKDRYSRNTCNNGKFRFNDTTLIQYFCRTHKQTHTRTQRQYIEQTPLFIRSISVIIAFTKTTREVKSIWKLRQTFFESIISCSYCMWVGTLG